MRNSLDEQYIDLLKDILKNGVVKGTRNGKTKSVFGRQIRHKMSDGFPLLTTKKMFTKGIFTELLWLLNGDTNIQWLCQNDCNIWVGDAYKKFIKAIGVDWNGGHLNELIERGCITETFIPKEESSEDVDFDTIHYEFLSEKGFIERIINDDAFAEEWGDLGPIYGKQWRSWSNYKYVVDSLTSSGFRDENPVDQISNLLNDLIKNPDSRRLMVNAWKVDEINQMTLPPCHYGFQVTTRELEYHERYKLAADPFVYADYVERCVVAKNIILEDSYKEENLKMWEDAGIPKRAISLIWTQRSVDTFLGLPFNIASYGALLMILGELTNMVPEELIGQLGDTHLYLDHLEQAQEQITREPKELPKLRISTEFWNPENVLGTNWDAIIEGIEIDDFQIEGYESHPAIKAPLSN
tara:strand:+ start:18103 stop:19332 length:1230 start_codon:yes stop_codon:yes gene_type:complete